MAIHPPENRLWWNEPVERGEIVWIAIAFLWGVFMFLFMIWWHFTGTQNLSNEAYRIDPDVFAERTEAFAEQYSAALQATLFQLNLLVATSGTGEWPGTYIIMAALLLAVSISQAGRTLGLDALLARRDPHPRLPVY